MIIGNTGHRKLKIRTCLLFLWSFFLAGILRGNEESLRFGRFGQITIYSNPPKLSRVVFFVSGDGGWNLGVVDMARALASLDALVVGIDITSYLRELARSSEKCSYPAGDLEELSKFVQKKYDFPTYITPVLIGYSSGATFVYAALVQAPQNTFLGAVSLGFCPDLILRKPLCRGNGLEWKKGSKDNEYIFLPATTLEVPWLVLQGEADKVCEFAATAAYVKQVPKGEIIRLPKVGHGFSVQKNWMPQFKDAFLRLFQNREPEPVVKAEEIKDLPLVEVPASSSGKGLMAVHISGDGGWGVTDRGISEGLSKNGISVIGLNSLKYFWTARTPDSSAKDLERVLRYYLRAWQKNAIIIIGYSLGADVLPFMINRLPPEIKSRVKLAVLLGPSQAANFEFHLTDWLGTFSRKNDLPVLPEIEKIKNLAIICFYGEEDQVSICKDLTAKGIKVIPVRSGHRFGRNFQPIIDAILEELKSIDKQKNLTGY